jgi:hypothetical protein
MTQRLAKFQPIYLSRRSVRLSTDCQGGDIHSFCGYLLFASTWIWVMWWNFPAGMRTPPVSELEREGRDLATLRATRSEFDRARRYP